MTGFIRNTDTFSLSHPNCINNVNQRLRTQMDSELLRVAGFSLLSVCTEARALVISVFQTLRERPPRPRLSRTERGSAQTGRWRGWRKGKAPCPFLCSRACACACAYVCASSSSSCARGGGGGGGRCAWRRPAPSRTPRAGPL